MEKKLLIVGLDVDDKSFHAYVLPATGEPGFAFKCRPSAAHLLSKLEEKIAEGYSLHFCYESTYSGYHLCRALKKSGHECSIIAAGLIPELASDRVKTDRLDAQKIANYFSKGLLTEIHIPSEEDEMDRTLIRSRSFIREQLREIKRHIISVGKQVGWNYRNEIGDSRAGYWTMAHRAWLNEKVKSASIRARTNFQLLISQLEIIEHRLSEYEHQIESLSRSEKYEKKVKALTCYRGINFLSAMLLVTEIGDVRRFSHPKKLTSYVGLDVMEYSSGGKERRYSITRMGNKHIRTTLMEANQRCHVRPGIGKPLKKRREQIDPEFNQIADRCMNRLYNKATRLHFAGKPVNKIKAACAREMLGFVWESLMKAS